ncbi:MAG: hypothetical protein IPM39_16620 [Chloroflexi bacterium]|nr:hypothetical protein [Chloroflexota bacterium]
MYKMPSLEPTKWAASWLPYCGLILLLIVLTACNGTAVTVPTPASVAVVPSLTASYTPLPAANVTATWTPRASNTPYITPTFVNTAVPPEIATRLAASGGLVPGGGSGSSGGSFPTITPAIPRSTQTAVAVSATAAFSATQEAATATQVAATATSFAASATPFPNNWRGSYFNNATLSGAPVLVRNDPNLNFNWGAGSPDPSLPNDRFSVRWERTVDLANANYLFYAFSDDGVRVYLNDVLIIDEWRSAANRVFYAVRGVGAGQHRLRVEYFEDVGNAHVGFSWQLATEGAWIGEYYANRDLTGPPAFIRQDGSIAFDWGANSPNGLPADNFSIRWVREVEFANQAYEFQARADDGVRVFENNNALIDRWGPNDGTETFRREVVLSGRRTIRVEYFEGAGNALVFVRIVGLIGTSTPTATPSPIMTSTGTPTTTPTFTPTFTPTWTPTWTPTPTLTATVTTTASVMTTVSLLSLP